LFVIEPDVFDFAVWVVWVGLLVAAKVRRALINFQTRFFCSQYVYFLRGCMQAVLHLGLLRLADAADGGEAVPLPALLWPSLHLVLVRVVPLFSCLYPAFLLSSLDLLCFLVFLQGGRVPCRRDALLALHLQRRWLRRQVIFLFRLLRYVHPFHVPVSLLSSSLSRRSALCAGGSADSCSTTG
jgi:hypothetical protein